MIGIPYYFTKVNRFGRHKNVIFDLIAMASTGFMLLALITIYGSRGEELLSELNPVRFIMISIVPLLILLCSENKVQKINSLDKQGFIDFPYYFTRYYAFMAIGLLLIYVAGLTSQSGEAIVRLYTLSSVGSLFSISITGSIFKTILSFYLALINSLFFLMTIFFPN
jgi:hypothetical protein